MKAKLLKALRFGSKSIAPLENKVTLVDIESNEFDRLEEMGKVAKPDSDELKIGVLIDTTTGKPAKAAADVDTDETDSELTLARATYKELFGEDAAPKAKLEAINKKIAERRELDAARGLYRDTIGTEAPAEMKLAELNKAIADKKAADDDLKV